MERQLLHSTRMTRRRRSRSSSAGFTLVELGAVVVIIGILAVIAVTSYRKYITHSKITEAQTVISSIRIAQEDYRSETGKYANVSDSTYCPAAPVYQQITGWKTDCPAAATTTAPSMGSLSVHIDGPVLFGYKTSAGNDSATFVPPSETPGAMWVNVASHPGPWYAAVAKGILAANGNKTILVGSSFTNNIALLDNAE